MVKFNGREARIQELVKRYTDYKSRSCSYYEDLVIHCLTVNHMRDIARQFNKEMHDSIENYLDEDNLEEN